MKNSLESTSRSIWVSVVTVPNMSSGGSITERLTEFPLKSAMLMIGTNNSNNEDNTAEEIADGIIAIVHKLQDELPDTKVLILAIFPRGAGPSAQREKNARASELASAIADDENVFFLDIGNEFLEEDLTLTKEIMPDLLHLSEKGYEIWGEAVTPKLKEMMGE